MLWCLCLAWPRLPLMPSVLRGDKAAAHAGLLAWHRSAASTSRPPLPAAHPRQLVMQRRPPPQPPRAPAAPAQPSGMQAWARPPQGSATAAQSASRAPSAGGWQPAAVPRCRRRRRRASRAHEGLSVYLWNVIVLGYVSELSRAAVVAATTRMVSGILCTMYGSMAGAR